MLASKGRMTSATCLQIIQLALAMDMPSSTSGLERQQRHAWPRWMGARGSAATSIGNPWLQAGLELKVLTHSAEEPSEQTAQGRMNFVPTFAVKLEHASHAESIVKVIVHLETAFPTCYKTGVFCNQQHKPPRGFGIVRCSPSLKRCVSII
mmetsp:Transcript_10585/g.24093  ORF Transcript_10585/g.24093 Transcript_10585/m.24093 type:complete len:151 (-) Transcript_10585:52-504(-)